MKRSRIILFSVLGLGGAIGIFSATLPPIHLDRSIAIQAPREIIERHVTLFTERVDSSTRVQFKFNYQPEGQNTKVIFGYTPSIDASDEMMLKLVWLFKKESMSNEMDSMLVKLKKVSEQEASQSQRN